MIRKVLDGVRKTSAVLAITLVLSATSNADVAIVVGIQDYQYTAFPKLKGCENDARDMSTALKNLGFKVHTLVGKEATHANILQAFVVASKEVTAKDNFVFFFAGHGYQHPKGILAWDAKPLGVNFVQRDDLVKSMMSVKSATRTVILDSCFSGAMAKSKGLAPVFRSRSAETNDSPAGGTETDDSFPDGPITFFTAAQSNESALEGDAPAPAHGVFTSCLLPLLKGPLNSWGAVKLQVAEEMEKRLGPKGDEQHPLLRPTAATHRRMFSNEAVTTPPPKTLLDLYATDNASDAAFKINVTPAATSQFQVGQMVTLDFKVTKPGYLVVLDKDAGKYGMVFPGKKDDGSLEDVDDCLVNSTFHLPRPNRVLTFDALSEDHIQCLFFTDKNRAKAVIDAMRSLSDDTLLPEFAKKELDSTVNQGDVFTRRMSFYVGGSLIGGAPAIKLGDLQTRISAAGDDASKWLSQLIKWDQKKGDETNPDILGPRLLTYINIELQSPDFFSPNHASILYDDSAKFPLRPETQALMKRKPTGVDLLKLNRWIIEDAFPENFPMVEKGGKRQ